MSAPAFTKAKRDEYLAELRRGLRRGRAAQAIRVRVEVVEAYWAEHPEFLERMELAEVAANEHVEEALFEAAASGNVPACRIWLERRAPERWGAGKASEGKPPRDPSPEQAEVEQLLRELSEG